MSAARRSGNLATLRPATASANLLLEQLELTFRALLTEEEVDIELGWASGYAVIPRSRGLRAPGELTFETCVIVYDALFMALAEDADTPVVTADGKLLKALDDTPFACLAHLLAGVGSLIRSMG